MKRNNSLIAVLMTALLLLWSGPQSVTSASDSSDRPVKLTTTARFSPIGSITGRGAVDGRALDGFTPIWGGELIQAPANESLRVSLDDIGQITLTNAAIVRLSTAVGQAEAAGRNLLIASLTNVIDRV